MHATVASLADASEMQKTGHNLMQLDNRPLGWFLQHAQRQYNIPGNATTARTEGSFNGGSSKTNTGPLVDQDIRMAGLLPAAERYRFRRPALVSGMADRYRTVNWTTGARARARCPCISRSVPRRRTALSHLHGEWRSHVSSSIPKSLPCS